MKNIENLNSSTKEKKNETSNMSKTGEEPVIPEQTMIWNSIYHHQKRKLLVQVQV